MARSTQDDPRGGDGTERPETDDSSDDSQKSYETILDQEIEEGLVELERPARGLVLSGLSAGLDLGFSVLIMAVLLTLGRDLPEPVQRILVANGYAVGFIFVILGRSELFTEHTTLAVLPVLDGQATVLRLLRLWGLVYAANLVGGALFARFVTLIGPALGSTEPTAFEELARNLVDHPWWVILLSGVLAGWMMGLLSWLVTAGTDTISKIFFVWLVTTAIGLAHLHHSIVGTVEVLSGVFLGFATVAEYGHFLLFATLGNALGGVIFVALVKYGHASTGKGAGPHQRMRSERPRPGRSRR